MIYIEEVKDVYKRRKKYLEARKMNEILTSRELTYFIAKKLGVAGNSKNVDTIEKMLRKIKKEL